MIKTFSVEQLNDTVSLRFECQPDFNVFTGLNGCGKTHVLKLLWLLMSGNLERIPGEVRFSRATLQTDDYMIEATLSTSTPSLAYEYSLATNTGFTGSMSSNDHDLDVLNMQIAECGSSIFFPTFRRVEGGFGLRSDRTFTRSGSSNSVHRSLHESLAAISDLLSVRNHRFVATLGTSDILRDLTRYYSVVSDRTQILTAELKHRLHKLLESDEYSADHAEDTLQKVKDLFVNIDAQQAETMTPLNVLREFVAEAIPNVGARITSPSFAGLRSAIKLHQLSAGEQQLLAFLTYNQLNEGAVIFIDEPELSLHIDWQRRLFPWLASQQRNNQFFVATHSPFIYASYADKEIEVAKVEQTTDDLYPDEVEFFAPGDTD